MVKAVLGGGGKEGVGGLSIRKADLSCSFSAQAVRAAFEVTKATVKVH